MRRRPLKPLLIAAFVAALVLFDVVLVRVNAPHPEPSPMPTFTWVPTASPTPTPYRGPHPLGTETTCDRYPSVVNAVAPEYPDVARDLGLGPVTALVDVELDARGQITAATIYKSSGNEAIDRAAIRVARESTYAPAKRNCRAVPGNYIFHVEFNPD